MSVHDVKMMFLLLLLLLLLLLVLLVLLHHSGWVAQLLRDRTVYVLTRVLFLPFRAPVLEPDFDLSFRKSEAECQVEPLADRKVTSAPKLVLQRHELFIRECRTYPTDFAVI